MVKVNGLDELAIAQNCAAVANLKYLIQVVRYKNHRYAPGFLAANDGIKMIDFGLGQGAGRLIHNQQPGVQT